MTASEVERVLEGLAGRRVRLTVDGTGSIGRLQRTTGNVPGGPRWFLDGRAVLGTVTRIESRHRYGAAKRVRYELEFPIEKG